MRGVRRNSRCTCRSCSGPPGGSRAGRLVRSPLSLFAGVVVPLALVSTSRNARAGQAAVSSPAVGLDGGVAAPPLLASAAGGPVGVGIGTTWARRRKPLLRAAQLTLAGGGSVLAGAELTMGGSGSALFTGGAGAPAAPGSVPERLGLAIVAANRIATLPYIWGGGHGSFDSAGYDCSGSVSYVLHGAAALAAPEDSSELERYGDPGPGRWITIYANASHTFMTLGGMRYDTSGLSATGSRWHPLDQLATAGYVVRHPVGL